MKTIDTGRIIARMIAWFAFGHVAITCAAWLLS